MRPLLVPTDLSEHADHALAFAAQLSQQLGNPLHVLHVYHLHAPADPHQPTNFQQADEAAKSKAEAELAAHLAKLKDDGLIPKGLNPDHTVELGLAVDTITAESERLGAAFVIMGTKGAGAAANKLLGSNASAVLQHSACPVIVVPKQTKLQPVTTMAYATDLRDPELAAPAGSLAERLGARLDLVHLSKEGEEASEEQLKSFTEAMKNAFDLPAVGIKQYPGSDLQAALIAYSEVAEIDLLAMTHRDRGFFQRLFQPSQTLKMALHTHVPLLALRKD